MLALTLQAMMRRLDRQVTLVPVYLGYEHAMEVNTYHNELKGSLKKKESFLQVLGILRKLCNYGRGFVNFGEPLTLNSYLSKHIPRLEKAHRGRGASGVDGRHRQRSGRTADNPHQRGCRRQRSDPKRAGVLAAERHTLIRDELQAQLNTYLDLLKAVPYSRRSPFRMRMPKPCWIRR